MYRLSVKSEVSRYISAELTSRNIVIRKGAYINQ